MLTPDNLKNATRRLEERYGDDILQRANNLYMYCFTKMHSYEIQYLKNNYKNIPIPFMKGGCRENAMVYTFLLEDMIGKQYSDYWDDRCLLIQITYFTAFCVDNFHGEKKEDFNWLVNINGGLAHDNFRKSFSRIERYNFIDKSKGSYSTKVKKNLIDKIAQFERKFQDQHFVDLFLKISRNNIALGL